MPPSPSAPQNKTKPIVVGLVGQDGHGILRLNSAHFAKALEQRGYNCIILDLHQPDSNQRFGEIVSSKEFSFAFGFSGVGSYLMKDDEVLWDNIRVPFLAFHLDNPCQHPSQHGTNSKYAANIYVAKDSFDTEAIYMRSTRPSYLIRRHVLIDRQRTVLPWRDRPIHYLYVKSGLDPAPYEAQSKQLDGHLYEAFWDCVRYCENRTDFLLAEVVAKRLGLAPESINAKSKPFWTLVRLIEECIRSIRMTWMANMLKNIPATIIGNGWDHIDKTGAKATFLSGKAAREIANLYGQSKFVFNINPATEHSVEERVFMGLNAWAGVVSDDNMFSRTHLSALPNFYGFDWADPYKENRIMTFLNEQQLSPSHCYEGWKLAEEYADINDFVDAALKIVSEMKGGEDRKR